VASLGVWSQFASAHAGRSNKLFVIARSKNRNVVRYDVRVDREGRLDDENPLHVYWILYAEDGRREALSWLERRFAYGHELTSKVSPSGFRFRLSSCPRSEIRVTRSSGGGYEAHANIRGRPAQLTRIYVRTSETGAMPRVLEVQLFGRDPATGTPVSERLAV
jgi:hypothetical protein